MPSRDTRTTTGARALLFDRLEDEHPYESFEQQPRRVLDREELLQSIRKELDLLLNTRSSRVPDTPDPHEWTVLDWGLPDFSPAFTRSPSDRRQLARRIEQAIVAFEPRLREPVVEVLEREPHEHELRIHISGSVQLGSLAEPVAFPLMLDTGAASGRSASDSSNG